MVKKKINPPKKPKVNTLKLRLWIADRPETMDQIAKRIGITRQTLWRIEKGSVPSFKNARKISKYTGNEITMEDLGQDL